MPLTPNFSYSQNYGTIQTASFQDTSTGSDGSITGRLIYIQKYDGTYLVPPGYTTNYIFWASAASSIDISSLLDKDYAVSVTVQWFAGSTIAYTLTQLCLFRAYSELFLRQLTQAQEGNPNLLSNNNFWNNKSKLRELVDTAIQAVAVLNSQTAATYALVEAKKLTDNIQTFY